MKLEIKNLSRSFGQVKAVSDISFSMDQGVYGLLGPNGAGKSTLMKMLTLQLKPTEGSILCDGKDIWELGSDYLGMLGYMPQQQNLYPNYTVEEFLGYMASLHGMKRDVTAERIGSLLEALELESKRKSRISTLSGGMKQRILLVQALIHKPQLLILDEPTAGLDPNQRILVRNLIMELAVDCTVLLATHVVQDVELISKEILLLRQGELVRAGNYQALCSEIMGQVRELTIPKSELKEYMERYQISSIRESLKGEYIIRILMHQASEGEQIGTAADATLEDVSLYYFGQDEAMDA